MTQRATLPMTIALLITTLGFATLIFVQEATSPPLVYGAYYAGTMVVLYLGVRIWLPHSDVLLLPMVTLLTGVGLIMIYRLTYEVPGVENLATTQAGWILVGAGALVAVVLLFRDYEKLFAYKYLLALAAVGLVASTFTPLGYEVNGARLWLQIGPATFQPSEFARIALIVFFAGYLAEKRDLWAATSKSFMGIQLPALKYFGPIALVWAASLGLLVFETYPVIARVFKWLTLALFAYVAAAFLARPDWGAVARATVLPQIRLDRAYLTTLVAIFGTTISPYLFSGRRPRRWRRRSRAGG